MAKRHMAAHVAATLASATLAATKWQPLSGSVPRGSAMVAARHGGDTCGNGRGPGLMGHGHGPK